MNWKELIFASIGTLLLFIASIACWVWSYQLAAPYLLGVTVQGVDPGNRSDQAVMLEPVLADLQSAKR